MNLNNKSDLYIIFYTVTCRPIFSNWECVLLLLGGSSSNEVIIPSVGWNMYKYIYIYMCVCVCVLYIIVNLLKMKPPSNLSLQELLSRRLVFQLTITP